METDDSAKLFIIFILLLLSGFFSSTETALFSLGKIRVRSKKFRSTPSFQYILRLLETPSKFLTTVLIGNEMVNISISVVVAALTYSVLKGRISDQLLPFLSVVITLPALLLFGEILPKTIALKFPEKIARVNSYPLYLFSLAIRPVQRVFNAVAGMFVHLFIKDLRESPLDSIRVDEDMFKSMVDIGSREGTIEQSERELIHKVFRLDDIEITHIMTARNNIVAIPIETSLEEVLGITEAEHYSRYPVYEREFDTIIGFVYVKDILRLQSKQIQTASRDIRLILRQPYFVQHDQKVLAVFLEFQKRNMHVGVIIDKSKHVLGIVTMEDILEELFGEIKDEHDIEEEKEKG